MPLSTTCRPISSIQGFSLSSGQTSIYLKIPAKTEISATITAIGGMSGGTLTIDYTQSPDDQVISSPSTAVWTNGARTITSSIGVGTGIPPLKIGQNCWLRFNCTSGTGSVSLNPSGMLADYTGAPFGGELQQDPQSGIFYANSGKVLIGGSSGLTGVTYNGSNQVTGYQLGGVTYAVTYPAGQIVVSGSDGSAKTITLDGSGRIVAVTG